MRSIKLHPLADVQTGQIFECATILQFDFEHYQTQMGINENMNAHSLVAI